MHEAELRNRFRPSLSQSEKSFQQSDLDCLTTLTCDTHQGRRQLFCAGTAVAVLLLLAAQSASRNSDFWIVPRPNSVSGNETNATYVCVRKTVSATLRIVGGPASSPSYVYAYNMLRRS